MDFLGIISNHHNAFLAGATMTAVVSAVSIALGMVLGLWLAFGLISPNRLIRRASAVYRSAWRGTPILVQLLIVFYLLPEIGLDHGASPQACASERQHSHKDVRSGDDVLVECDDDVKPDDHKDHVLV